MSKPIFSSNNPEEVYDNWLIICEAYGYSLSWPIIRGILIATQKFFENKGNVGIAKYIGEIILKEAEVEAGDWDNIRFLLHREIDPEQPEPTDFLEMIKKKYGSL
jgi:hypothetical protein